MDSISFLNIRRPKVRLNPPAGAVTDFPLDIAGILALAGISELLGVPVPETAIQLVELSSDTVLHWSARENAELLAWLPQLVPGDSSNILVELYLPDDRLFTLSRTIFLERAPLHDWLTRNEA